MQTCPACGSEIAYKTMCASCGASFDSLRLRSSVPEAGSRRLLSGVYWQVVRALVFLIGVGLVGGGFLSQMIIAETVPGIEWLFGLVGLGVLFMWIAWKGK